MGRADETSRRQPECDSDRDAPADVLREPRKLGRMRKKTQFRTPVLLPSDHCGITRTQRSSDVKEGVRGERSFPELSNDGGSSAHKAHRRSPHPAGAK